MKDLVQVTLRNTSNGATFNVSPDQVKHYTRMSNIEIVKTPKVKVTSEVTPKKTVEKKIVKSPKEIKETIELPILAKEGEKAIVETIETEIQVTK